MQHEPVITWRNVQRSEAVDAIIRKRIEAVERFCPNAAGLRITLDAPKNPGMPRAALTCGCILRCMGRIWALRAVCDMAMPRTMSPGR